MGRGSRSVSAASIRTQLRRGPADRDGDGRPDWEQARPPAGARAAAPTSAQSSPFTAEASIQSSRYGNGRMMAGGAVLDAMGSQKGHVERNGKVVNTVGQTQGQVRADGSVVGLYGEAKGRVDPDGSVHGIYGEDIGRVSPGAIGAGAGLLLLLDD